MPRPNDLSNEQLISYEQELSQEPSVVPLLQQPIIKEVLLAGKYLNHKLIELNCPEELIGRILYTAGQMSFGRDPWEMHQDLLQQYRDNKLIFEDS